MQFVDAKILQPFTVSGLPEFQEGEVRQVEITTALEFAKRGLVEVLGQTVKELEVEVETKKRVDEDLKNKNAKLK